MTDGETGESSLQPRTDSRNEPERVPLESAPPSPDLQSGLIISYIQQQIHQFIDQRTESSLLPIKSLIELHEANPDMAMKVLDVYANEAAARHTAEAKDGDRAFTVTMTNIVINALFVIAVLVLAYLALQMGYPILAGVMTCVPLVIIAIVVITGRTKGIADILKQMPSLGTADSKKLE